MGMLAKVEGEVKVRTEAKTVNIQFYEEEFILDDDVKEIGLARSIIRKGMINERLRKTIPNFKGVRTCQVTSLKPTDKKSETTELEKKLAKASKLGCVPERLDQYADNKSKEKALDKAIESFEARKKNKKKDNVEDLGVVD